MPLFFKTPEFKKLYIKEPILVKKAKQSKAKNLNIFSNFIFLLGIFVFTFFWAIPFVSTFFYKSESEKFVYPFGGSVLGYVYTGLGNEFSFEELKSAQKPAKLDTSYEPEFYLSIPALDIKDALVETNSTNLNPKDKLGHYAKTALPGEIGNAFIFGHSSLPFFYNKDNYETIFTHITELVPDKDTIEVKYGGTKYVYKVRFAKELDPTEIDPYKVYYPSVYNKSTITLMTCTPAGSKKYRYIVLGELE